MPNVGALKQRAVELKREVSDKIKALENDEITTAEFTQYWENSEKENAEISKGIKAYNHAMSYRNGDGGGDPASLNPSGTPPALEPTALQRQYQANLKTYQDMRACAQANLANKGSGRGTFSFDVALKAGREAPAGQAEVSLLTQGTNANMMGAQTSGATVPPTGNLAQNQYFYATPPGTAGPAIVPEFIPGIVEMRFYPNVIADLFPTFPVSSPIATYVKETAWSNQSVGTPEAATKPTSTSSLTRYTEQVGKIANLERVTDELIQDAGYFWGLIQRRGVMGVTRKEEVDLLAGTGMPSINGLLNRTQGTNTSYPVGFTAPQTVTAQSVTIGGAVGSGALPATVTGVKPGRLTTDPSGVGTAEAILAAITDIRVLTFFEPDAVVLNPQDWTTVRLAKDTTGNYLGGSFFGYSWGERVDAGPTGIEENLLLWGKRMVSTPAMPPGLVLVGDFADAGQVLRLGGLRVDITNLNGFDFEQNVWTMRIEERVGLLVDRPELFELIALAGGS
jgi:HK97 family phage major capsid protein